MSTEGFEKKRIQDPDQAHQEANMLASLLGGEWGPTATAQDYDNALYQLELLEKTINEQSTPESIDKAIRAFFAGGSLVVTRIGTLLAAAVLNVLPYPQDFKKQMREQLLDGGVIEQLKRIPKDYAERRALFQTAREELERWKVRAEEYAKKQSGQ